MRKKTLFVLAMVTMVLAASPLQLASAVAVSLVLSSDLDDVYAGNTVTINVIADFAVSSAIFNLMESTTSVAGDAMASAVGNLNAAFDFCANDGFLANGMAGNRFILIDRIMGLRDKGLPPIAAGAALYFFDVVIPVAAELGDTFTIDDVFGVPVYKQGMPYYTDVHVTNGPTVSDIESLTLKVIPEPMTIALLGLGGMILLRKRRA